MKGDQINMPSSETLNLFLSNNFKKHYMSVFKAHDVIHGCILFKEFEVVITVSNLWLTL